MLIALARPYTVHKVYNYFSMKVDLGGIMHNTIYSYNNIIMCIERR